MSYTTSDTLPKDTTFVVPSHPESTRTIDKLKVGEQAIVSALTCNQIPLLRKLLSMGVIEGAQVRVLNKGPLGSPINVRILGSILSLRRSEASQVQVTA